MMMMIMRETRHVADWMEGKGLATVDARLIKLMMMVRLSFLSIQWKITHTALIVVVQVTKSIALSLRLLWLPVVLWTRSNFSCFFLSSSASTWISLHFFMPGLCDDCSCVTLSISHTQQCYSAVRSSLRFHIIFFMFMQKGNENYYRISELWSLKWWGENGIITTRKRALMISWLHFYGICVT